jgi:hypothetical protein
MKMMMLKMMLIMMMMPSLVLCSNDKKHKAAVDRFFADCLTGMLSLAPTSDEGRYLCCGAQCGSCGESEKGCSHREGGAASCCARDIQAAGDCVSAEHSGCVVREGTIPGVHTNARRVYDLDAVNRSVAAAQAVPHRVAATSADVAAAAGMSALAASYGAAAARCAQNISGASSVDSFDAHHHKCIDMRGAVKVSLSRGQVYMLPAAAKPVDNGIIHGLLTHIVSKGESIVEFGAGVGQIGRFLVAHAPDSRMAAAAAKGYTGYDGAGNVLSASSGFVKYFDEGAAAAAPPPPLVVEGRGRGGGAGGAEALLIPRADWVLSLEAAQHVPAGREDRVFRALHAHNCRGVVLAWGLLLSRKTSVRGAGAERNVNNHSPEYVSGVMRGLG